MEQEVGDLLQSRYQRRAEILRRVRQRWEQLPMLPAEQLQEWQGQGRHHFGDLRSQASTEVS
jgi:hypothetical protein